MTVVSLHSMWELGATLNHIVLLTNICLIYYLVFPLILVNEETEAQRVQQYSKFMLSVIGQSRAGITYSPPHPARFSMLYLEVSPCFSS